MKRLRPQLVVASVLVVGGWLAVRQYGQTLSAVPDNGTLTTTSASDVCDRGACDLVVDFKDDVPHEQLAALETQLGIRLHAVSKFVDADEIYTLKGTELRYSQAELLAYLRSLPEVEAADVDAQYTIPEAELALTANTTGPESKGFPNDPKYQYQWHLEQIRMKDAWKGAQGDGVVVAVLDTGVAKVPDLEQSTFVDGWNFIANNSNAADDHGHGTHVAGTIAQSTNNGVGVAGVAFKAKIMPVKVLSGSGSGSLSGIADGIRYAADHGAKVINMSLGGPMGSSVLAKAIVYARSKGVVVVCAAGNDGRGKVSYPAASPGAVAVAATQFDESTTFYSNWGKEIDIAAPGGNTRVDQNKDGMMDGVLQNTVIPGRTSENDYLLFMGTSMASPHVAGVVALIMSTGVTEPDAVEKILFDSARAPKGDKNLIQKGPENRYGAGLMDAGAAVKAARHKVGGGELGVAAFAAIVLGALARRRGGALKLGVAGVSSLVMGASGLFFLQDLIPSSWGGFAAPAMLSGPIWQSSNPLLASAALPMAAVLLLYGVRKLRPTLVGLTLGIGGSLLFHAVVRTFDVAWMPNFLDATWLAVNGAIALGIGYLVMRKE